MPNVVGMAVADAQSTLQGVGFVVDVVGQVYSDLPVGLVAQTSPAAGSTMYTGSTVSVYTSAGPAPPTSAPPTTAPGVTGPPAAGTSPGNPGNGNGRGRGPGHHH